MSFLGIVGGGIVIAMCLPVFNLISKLAYLELPRGRLVGPRTGLPSTNDALLLSPCPPELGRLLRVVASRACPSLTASLIAGSPVTDHRARLITQRRWSRCADREQIAADPPAGDVTR